MKRWLDFVVGVPLVKLLSLWPRRAQSNASINKILLIKLAAAGDTILLIPVLRALRAAHPSIKIHWLVSPINRQIAETVPYVDNLIVWNRSITTLPGLLSALRHQDYDAVIDFEQWARGTALISFFTGAPIRAGYTASGQHRDALFTHTIEKKFLQHEISDFFDLAQQIVPVQKDLRLEIFETERGEAEVRRALEGVPKTKKESIRVLIHPGCGHDGAPREWPLLKYGVLIHWLQKKFSAQIFLSGGPEEKKKTSDLNRLIGGSAFELAGALSWEGTTSLLNHIDLVVSGNTGIMHLAAAKQKKQVALHGPTNAAVWGPLNPNARNVITSCSRCPCLKLGFEYHTAPLDCMNMIEVDQVKEAVSSLI